MQNEEDIVDMGGNQPVGTSNTSSSHTVYSNRPQPAEVRQPTSIRWLTKIGITNPKVGSLILLAFAIIISFITVQIYRSAATPKRPIPGPSSAAKTLNR